MKLEIVPFRLEHLQELTARPFEAREMSLVKDPGEYAREYLRRGTAFTDIRGGKILACAGLFLLWRGVAEVWAVTTERVPHYPKTFHQAIKNGLNILIKSTGVWRVQCAIHREHRVSQNWITRLGFGYEASMPGYGPDGAAYERFALIIPENLPQEENH